jgi:hypothetical protein
VLSMITISLEGLAVFILFGRIKVVNFSDGMAALGRRGRGSCWSRLMKFLSRLERPGKIHPPIFRL